MIVTVTRSARASLKEIRSCRASLSGEWGEKLGVRSKRWMAVGVCLSRWVTKNAAKQASTSSAKTARASGSTPAGRAGCTPGAG